jgi:hypothetical protein
VEVPFLVVEKNLLDRFFHFPLLFKQKSVFTYYLFVIQYVMEKIDSEDKTQEIISLEIDAST